MNARQLALDALKLAVLQNGCDMIMTGEELRKCEAAIAALEADIAQAVEPVACAWAVRRNDGGLQLFFVEESARRESECGMWRNPVIPLFTTPPEPAWQPIATAPKGGSEILLSKGTRVTLGCWFTEKWPVNAEYHSGTSEYLGQFETGERIEEHWSTFDGGFADDDQPTFWMPLPAAPKATS